MSFWLRFSIIHIWKLPVNGILYVVRRKNTFLRICVNLLIIRNQTGLPENVFFLQQMISLHLYFSR
jgi:hypothetical protein